MASGIMIWLGTVVMKSVPRMEKALKKSFESLPKSLSNNGTEESQDWHWHVPDHGATPTTTFLEVILEVSDSGMETRDEVGWDCRRLDWESVKVKLVQVPSMLQVQKRQTEEESVADYGMFGLYESR